MKIIQIELLNWLKKEISNDFIIKKQVWMNDFNLIIYK